MFTNTYLPHVGGVARAIRTIRDGLRARGHRVTIFAPSYDTVSDDEADIVRLPALSTEAGFALPLALPQLAGWFNIDVDVVHVHHPNLMGAVGRDFAQRVKRPVVFTYHTMYEHYAHLLPTPQTLTASALIHQAANFCNTCQIVIAPSTDVANILKQRGVRKMIAVLPTGIDTIRFMGGNWKNLRRRYNIPPGQFVAGYCGRLTKEKNLQVLASAAQHYPSITFLVVGDGAEREMLTSLPNVILTGALSGQDLVDAYHAMNVFAFPSVSETQGLVVAEALAAGTPVVAIASPGINDVVKDGVNGCLCRDAAEFIRRLPDAWNYRAGAQASVRSLDITTCVQKLEKIYTTVRPMAR